MTPRLAAARNSKIGDIATDNVLDMAAAIVYRCERGRTRGIGGVHVAMTGAGEVYAPQVTSQHALAAVMRPGWHVGTYEAPVSREFIADDLRTRALELGVLV